MKQRDLLVYLHTLKGIGWKTIDKLVTHLDSLESILLMQSLELSMQAGLDYRTAEIIIQSLETEKINIFLQLLKKWEQKHIRIITYFDSNYPTYLKEIYQPPWVFFTKGDQSLLNNPIIAIVGTRNPSQYGRIIAEKLAKELTEHGFIIVSGMARGIDRKAHEGSLLSGATIAVLGSGIDIVYPKENQGIYQEIEEKGLIISEYSPGTKPHPAYFPQRNRLISGLSLGTIIIEASLKSGSLITAQLALEQSREVFAIPGNITSNKSLGTNSLIQQGAKLVMNIEDIIEEFKYLSFEGKIHNKIEIKLNNKEQKVMAMINYNPIHIDDLFNHLEFSFSEIYEILLSLQLKQKVKQIPGGTYIKNG